MRETEFAVPKRCDLSRAAGKIEEICARFGLTVAMKGTLSAYPGCVHWHYRNGREKGTLELTLAVPERRLWASVHTNRQAAWIDAMLPRVRKEIENVLTF
jgi:hypothetical protein